MFRESVKKWLAPGERRRRWLELNPPSSEVSIVLKVLGVVTLYDLVNIFLYLPPSSALKPEPHPLLRAIQWVLLIYYSLLFLRVSFTIRDRAQRIKCVRGALFWLGLSLGIASAYSEPISAGTRSGTILGALYLNYLVITMIILSQLGASDLNELMTESDSEKS